MNPIIKPLTPKELYLQRVSGVFEYIRAQSAGQDFIPADFGGLFGQRDALSQDIALELITLKPE